MKIDHNIDGLLIPIVEYEIYKFKIIDSNNINELKIEKLDLKMCNNLKIEILYPAKINEKEEFKYNQYSKYYKDICESNLTLYDRKKEYNDNNMSICEKNCTYNGYLLDIKKSKCICNIKVEMPLISQIVINKEKLIYNFINIKKSLNIEIMKCYHILLSKNGLIKNIGSYIILSLLSINRINTLFFIYKEYKYKLLYSVIDNIIKEKEIKKICNESKEKKR